MPRSKTTTKSTDPIAPVESVVTATPTPTINAASTEVKAKKTKAVKTPKSESTASVVVSTPEVVVTPAVTASSTEEPVDVIVADAEPPISEQSFEFLAKLQQMSVMISAMKAEYRNLEKRRDRELKAAQKQGSRRKRKAGNRAPSGFVKPTRISDELASFLGKEKGTEMARTAVTRDINTYIRDNKLQNASNGRKINPDEKLTSLLKITPADELTYFNLQRFMSPHFAKSVKAEAVTTSTA
jgi:upstream activation factor subunit UAF30